MPDASGREGGLKGERRREEGREEANNFSMRRFFFTGLPRELLGSCSDGAPTHPPISPRQRSHEYNFRVLCHQRQIGHSVDTCTPHSEGTRGNKNTKQCRDSSRSVTPSPASNELTQQAKEWIHPTITGRNHSVSPRSHKQVKQT